MLGDYKKVGNLITHVNFFSEGSMWYLLDKYKFNIKYLKLSTAISHIRYEPMNIAIAENSSKKIRK